MPMLNEAIDLTPYAPAVNGALAHHRPAFVATSAEDRTPDISPNGAYSSLMRTTWPIWNAPKVVISPTCNCSRQALCKTNSEFE